MSADRTGQSGSRVWRVIVIVLLAVLLAAGGVWGGVQLRQADAFGWAGAATPVASETPTPSTTPTPTPAIEPVELPETCDELFSPAYVERAQYYELKPLDDDNIGGATADPVISQLMLEVPHVSCWFDASSFHNFTFATAAQLTPSQAEVVSLRMTNLGISCEQTMGGTHCSATTTDPEYSEYFYATSSIFLREGILIASHDVTTGLTDHLNEAVRMIFGDSR